MGDISYNQANLSGKVDAFIGYKNKSDQIGDEVASHIAAIKNVWTGSEAELGGRDRDFDNILTNLNKISANLKSIAEYLNDKNSNFSQINYK